MYIYYVDSNEVKRFLEIQNDKKLIELLHGIGTDWNWCIFDLYDYCLDHSLNILIVCSHYVFYHFDFFNKFVFILKSLILFFLYFS